MLARCARCQGTFTTDHYGRQTCPHCAAELILPEPAAAPGGAEAPPAAPPQPTPRAPAPEAPQAAQAPAAAPPPPAAAAQPPPRAEPPPGAQPPPGTPPGAPPPPGYGPPPGGGWAPPPGGAWGPPPGPGPELPSPFADRGRIGLFAAFFETWKLVATQPQQFFSRVRIDQTGSAILFGVIASTVGNLASSIYAYFSGQQALVAMRQVIERLPEEQGRLLRIYGETMSGGAIVAQIVLSPLLTVIIMYLGAAVLHLLLMLFRGASRGFDATLTVVAYANGLFLLLALPGCGGLLAGVWGLVATIVGLGAAQRCGAGKATAAVLAPAVLLCVFCCGVFGLAFPALLKGLQEATKQGQGTTL